MGVLVVDDFMPFREWVSNQLTSKLGFEILGHAADGVQAVQKAAELTPDLVILDMGLPKMNGLEVARQIRIVSPASRIVFLTASESPDLVRAALESGAGAYVSKCDASDELVNAIEAAYEGPQYVSNRLASRYLDDVYGQTDEARN